VNSDLNSIPGIRSVEKTADIDGSVSFRIYPSGDHPLLTQVSQLARDKNWQVEDLHVTKGKLDDVFRSITTTQAS
jgi:ABC-2 type transport system ATP-binding protein